MNQMAEKKRQAKSKQPGRIVRVREALYEVVEIQAEAEFTTPTEYVNRLIRKSLEEAGLWPPGRKPN